MLSGRVILDLFSGMKFGGKELTRAAEYFKDLDTYGSTLSNGLKAVLIGLPSAGKTSVAARLEGCAPDALPTAEERTVGVEIHDFQLGPGAFSEDVAVGLDVKLWDFAGQKAYYDTHQVRLVYGPPLHRLPLARTRYARSDFLKKGEEETLHILRI